MQNPTPTQPFLNYHSYHIIANTGTCTLCSAITSDFLHQQRKVGKNYCYPPTSTDYPDKMICAWMETKLTAIRDTLVQWPDLTPEEESESNVPHHLRLSGDWR
jgi:hypothetical protein